MSTEKTDPASANETPPTPDTVDIEGSDPENKGTEEGDPLLDLDDLFEDFDDIEDPVPNAEEPDADVEDVEDLIEEGDVEIEVEPEPEPEPVKQPWEAPEIPQPSQSIQGMLWDVAPKFVRTKLKAWGLEAPLDATVTDSHIGGGMEKGAMLLGPPSAGKTTLIAAINRACLIPVESPVDLRWKARGDEETQTNLTQLLDQAIDQILQGEESIKATNDHKRYDFSIEGRVKAGRHFNGAQAFPEMNLSFHDGPGGAMFTLNKAVWESQESTRMQMLQEAKGAYTLLFCFNGAERNARMMQASLARILPLLQSRRRQDRGYLYPLRVVILLNKIDQVCDGFYNKLAGKYSELTENSSVTPETIAYDLDPLSMAIECLGYESLKMLRDAMRPDAELAVGLISTWGFNNEGLPLVDSAGKPNVITYADNGPANEFVSQWRPFGVRETIMYLATGKEAPMIQIIEPSDFNKDLRPPDNYRF